MSNPTSCPTEDLADLLRQASEDQQAGLLGVDQLLRAYPEDPRLHFLRGSLLAAERQYEAAQLAMRQAVRLDPDYAIARFQLGLLQLSSGAPDEAAATWRPLEARSPDDPLRLFAEGLVHMAAERFASATALLERGRLLNTDNPALNRDMEMILGEIAQAQSSEAGDQLSPTQQLLQQSLGKRTMH